MLPATTPGVIASWDATSSSRASREMRLATISTTWQKRPVSNDSRNGLRGTSSSEFFSYDLRSLDHCPQFCECNFLRKMQAPTIGQNEHPLRGYEFQSFPNSFCHDLRRLDFMGLYVNHADAKFELVREFFEQFQVFAAAPREFKRQLLNVRFKDCGKEISIVAGPRRLAVPVAVAHMQCDLRVDAVNQCIHDLHAPLDIFWKAGVVGLVNLNVPGAGASEFFELHVHDAREIHRKGFFILVVLVFDPFDERVRTRNAKLRGAVGE